MGLAKWHGMAWLFCVLYLRLDKQWAIGAADLKLNNCGQMHHVSGYADV